MKFKLLSTIFVALIATTLFSCAPNSESSIYEITLQLKVLHNNSVELQKNYSHVKEKMTELNCDSITKETQNATKIQKSNQLTDSNQKVCEELSRALDSLKLLINQNRLQVSVITEQIAKIDLEETEPIEGPTVDPPCPPEAECQMNPFRNLFVAASVKKIDIQFIDESGKSIDAIAKIKSTKNGKLKKYILKEGLEGKYEVRIKKISEIFPNGISYGFSVEYPYPKK